MKILALVFIGGGVGSVCRYGISRAFAGGVGTFPWATLIANLLSCFLVGLLMEWSAKGWLSPSQRWVLTTGFWGGFSTFSTFAGETFDLYQRGMLWTAFANVALSLFICMAGLISGMKLAAQL